MSDWLERAWPAVGVSAMVAAFAAKHFLVHPIVSQDKVRQSRRSRRCCRVSGRSRGSGFCKNCKCGLQRQTLDQTIAPRSASSKPSLTGAPEDLGVTDTTRSAFDRVMPFSLSIGNSARFRLDKDKVVSLQVIDNNTAVLTVSADVDASFVHTVAIPSAVNSVPFVPSVPSHPPAAASPADPSQLSATESPAAPSQLSAAASPAAPSPAAPSQLSAAASAASPAAASPAAAILSVPVQPPASQVASTPMSGENGAAIAVAAPPATSTILTSSDL